MTIGFSPKWTANSWSTSPGSTVTAEEEKTIIIEMVKNCSDQTIRTYAASESELGVYVRTGIHRSKSDPKYHVHVVVGSNNKKTWARAGAKHGYTAHIYYVDHINSVTKTFPAKRWNGQPHLNRRGTDVDRSKIPLNYKAAAPKKKNYANH